MSELAARSGDDDLARRVVVRDDDVRSDERARDDVRVESDHRGHRTQGIGGLHELASRADQPHRIREPECTARDERAELAERMAEDDDRLRQRTAHGFLGRA